MEECYSAFSREESAFNPLLGLGFPDLIHPLKLGVQVLDSSPEEWQLVVSQSSHASHLSLKLFKRLHALTSSWRYCCLSPRPLLVHLGNVL